MYSMSMVRAFPLLIKRPGCGRGRHAGERCHVIRGLAIIKMVKMARFDVAVSYWTCARCERLRVWCCNPTYKAYLAARLGVHVSFWYDMKYVCRTNQLPHGEAISKAHSEALRLAALNRESPPIPLFINYSTTYSAIYPSMHRRCTSMARESSLSVPLAPCRMSSQLPLLRGRIHE